MKRYAEGKCPEILTAETVDQAVDEYICDRLPEDIAEVIEIYEYEPIAVDTQFFDNILEMLFDELYMEYGCQDEDAATPSDKAGELFNAFVSQVTKDYPVRHLQGTGNVIKVNTRDYLKKIKYYMRDCTN